MASATPQRLCPDCSYRTSSPAVSHCPICNVPLMAGGRIMASAGRPSRPQGTLLAGDEGDRPIEVAVRHLNARGGRLEHRQPLRPGQTYLLTLLMTDGARQLSLPVRVLRSSPRPEEPQRDSASTCRSDVELVDLAAPLERELAAYLAASQGTCPGPLRGWVTALPE